MNDRIVDSLPFLTMSEQGLSDNRKRIAQQPSGSQQQLQAARQERKRRKEKRKRKRDRREKVGTQEGEEGERDQEGRKEDEEKEAEEGGGEQVKKDATDWVEVRRRTRGKSCRMVQIFVKVNGSKATPMEVNLTDDKVEDVMKRIQTVEDAYVMMQGKVLRTNEKLKSCGVTDGCTIQVTSRMRGGGTHKDKKSTVEKKRVTRQEPVRKEDPAILESEKEAVVRMLEETEEYRKIVRMCQEEVMWTWNGNETLGK